MKPSERLQQQKKYVQYMDDGQKSIILRWKEKVRIKSSDYNYFYFKLNFNFFQNKELKESRANNFEIVREQLYTVPDSGSYKKS